ncbi:hypothetical protein J6590_008820 [Homalodisca vitripennis]|nr:hypothetical protein J6590_008820 [Homalodisca vitripennis]
MGGTTSVVWLCSMVIVLTLASTMVWEGLTANVCALSSLLLPSERVEARDRGLLQCHRSGDVSICPAHGLPPPAPPPQRPPLTPATAHCAD